MQYSRIRRQSCSNVSGKEAVPGIGTTQAVARMIATVDSLDIPHAASNTVNPSLSEVSTDAFSMQQHHTMSAEVTHNKPRRTTGQRPAFSLETV